MSQGSKLEKLASLLSHYEIDIEFSVWTRV